MQIQTRKQIRLQGYDYSRAGAYFITICSKNREYIFGKINKTVVGALLACALSDEMQQIELTEIGRIIEKQWRGIPNQFNNVELDEFIIMPNHIHGILILHDSAARAQAAARTQAAKRAQASSAPTTISLIIRSFKSKCTMEYLNHIDENNLNMSGKIWQRGYYDHIIRDDLSLHNIREYIVNNPLNWADDENNLHNKSFHRTQKVRR